MDSYCCYKNIGNTACYRILVRSNICKGARMKNKLVIDNPVRTSLKFIIPWVMLGLICFLLRFNQNNWFKCFYVGTGLACIVGIVIVFRLAKWI